MPKSKIEENMVVVTQRIIWGDYGNALISGYATRDQSSGLLRLQRTGPFLPPISFPYESAEGSRIVVSNSFRKIIDTTGISGLEFRRVIKGIIAKLHWESWDLSQPDPMLYPADGEPSNYIRNQTHDESCAQEMDEAWEFLPTIMPLDIIKQQDKYGQFLDSYVISKEARVYPDVFLTGSERGQLVANVEMKKWLQKNVGDWIRFSKIYVR